MLPSSSFPEAPSPRKKPSNIRLVVTGLVTGVLVVAFAGVLVARGVGNTPRLASGPAATATSLTTTATDVATTDTGTPAPGATPLPTTSAGNPATQTGAVRVTQNQDMQPACASDTAPYTVVLFNGGSVTATWQVNIPEFVGLAPGGPTALSQPLFSPLSSTPYWANPTPKNGSVAPGQTASFVMNVYWPMPCGGTTYHAAVQLGFPAGTSQADIPLTYTGTGPARYTNVVLVSGSLNITQPCPATGTAPASFTFAIKNTGNYVAVFLGIVPFDTVGSNQWATFQSEFDPIESRGDWIYPGQTLTVTISPVVGVSCDGTVYRTKVYSTNPAGTVDTITLTDTFTTP